ncbi:hypothetical protein NC652_027242 [Populus alba x Populus x berolinensis]|nr:hypothetical protein NC652_027242 [Populus alba x Populus x berolinensis]
MPLTILAFTALDVILLFPSEAGDREFVEILPEVLEQGEQEMLSPSTGPTAKPRPTNPSTPERCWLIRDYVLDFPCLSYMLDVLTSKVPLQFELQICLLAMYFTDGTALSCIVPSNLRSKCSVNHNNIVINDFCFGARSISYSLIREQEQNGVFNDASAD